MASKDKKDKKDKAPKLKDSEAEEKILAYINKQNRPYNAQIISDNLKKAVGKTQATKILNTLADRGEIASKGEKAKIYWKKQDDGEIDENEVKELDQNIATLTAEVSGLNGEVNKLGGEIKALNEQLTDAELDENLKLLSKETPELEKKLKALSSNQVCVSEADRKAAEAKYQKLRSAWVKRKRLYREIVGTASENTGKSIKELQEELCLETDEDKGVSLGDDLVDNQKRKRK